MKLSDSDVLYADNHLLIAIKPAGILTQPDGTNAKSLEEFAKLWLKRDRNKPGNVFLHAVHRLDKPVSGLVLFAKTSKALKRLNEQSRNGEIQRIYLAEVEGILPQKNGQLDHFLIHGDRKAILGKEGDLNAKHARLFFTALQYMPHSTLVRIELETGRYHQIRAQFSAIGHPVVGDKKYGAKMDKEEKIHLHAEKLAFYHPVTLELLKFESPAPF